ncbi:EF-1 guanine nucleotide exchange domain-containing protein [Prochlorococcus sp. MIT 1011]|uniref:EF-1 guanine nucleotide exchange domain-containing protein n=1 Tax=Prochlorococcus sp. MIT 1011 TaxID=3082520 RepID=UPI0039B4C366
MSLTAIECPDGVCHSHHGGHAVPRTAMQKNLQSHGKEWCERLAERIYEMSVDTFSQTVMPSLHSSGWQRQHLDWEFKLANKESEPDEALVEGIINATESFLRSSEVHRLFIQELVQGTFAEAKDDKLPSKAVRKVIENEIIVMIEGSKEELTNKIAKALEEEANGDFELAKNAAVEGINDVEKLLINHTEAV